MVSTIERFHCIQDSQLGPNGVHYREVLLYAGQPSLLFMMYIHTLHVSVDSVTTPPPGGSAVSLPSTTPKSGPCVSATATQPESEKGTLSPVLRACVRACACVCRCITCVNNHILSMPTEFNAWNSDWQTK